jgi:starch phosphorylase
MLFQRLDREAWKDTCHNPVKLLEALPRDIVSAAAEDPDFVRACHEVVARLQDHLEAPADWFCANVTEAECAPIANLVAPQSQKASFVTSLAKKARCLAGNLPN